MGRVMAVSFERFGRLYYLDPAGFDPAIGDHVLVGTDDGPVVAECVWASEEVAPEVEDVRNLPACLGPATEEDLARDARVRRRKADATVVLRRLVRELGLVMKIAGVDVAEPANRITAWFTAPARVDFRQLVSEAAHTLDATVLLRQLSARDQARLQGGIGPCGRDLCCATFLREFEPVSIAMARDQDLPLNPLRISGACGRLMCCLKYEHPLYQAFTADAPAKGTHVETDAGDGVVVGHNVPSDTVVVRLDAGGSTCACPKASVCASRKAYDTRD